MRLRTGVLIIALGLCLAFGGALAATLQVRAFRENLNTAVQGAQSSGRR